MCIHFGGAGFVSSLVCVIFVQPPLLMQGSCFVSLFLFSESFSPADKFSHTCTHIHTCTPGIHTRTHTASGALQAIRIYCAHSHSQGTIKFRIKSTAFFYVGVPLVQLVAIRAVYNSLEVESGAQSFCRRDKENSRRSETGAHTHRSQ